MKYMKATFVARSLLICLFCIASFTLSTGRAAAKVGRIGANNMANAATTQCGSWSIVASPNISGSDTDFGAVAAVSANDIWAVGNQANANTSIARTLTEHWNGSSWSIVSSPNIGPSGNTFYGVAAISSNDVWAVGYAVDSSTNISHTLIEHWNGSSWSIVASPNAGDAYNLLQSVTTVSSNDVWAVGYARSNGNFQTLIEHWNGSSWSVVSSPNPGTAANTLYAVHAVTVNDVWASG